MVHFSGVKFRRLFPSGIGLTNHTRGFFSENTFEKGVNCKSPFGRLMNHCKSAHNGRPDLNCNACKEMTEKFKKKKPQYQD